MDFDGLSFVFFLSAPLPTVTHAYLHLYIRPSTNQHCLSTRLHTFFKMAYIPIENKIKSTTTYPGLTWATDARFNARRRMVSRFTDLSTFACRPTNSLDPVARSLGSMFRLQSLWWSLLGLIDNKKNEGQKYRCDIDILLDRRECRKE
jgi:hypothetical protein